MKKIVIISYLFPPCARAGAFRAYSMAEYLPLFNWQPVFITPEKCYYGRLPREDSSLLDIVGKFPVYRTPFYYPFNNHNANLFPRGIRRIWEAFLIPDGKVFWNISIKKEIGKIIYTNKPDIIFITGAPFSSFLLAQYLKKNYGIPIVLDYRDPWAANPGIERNNLRAKLALRYEKKALSSADLITTASYHIINYIKITLGAITDNKDFFGFPYGYNGEFFKKAILPIALDKLSNKITATFAGYVHGDIKPETILAGIKSAIDSDRNIAEKLRINCYGTLFGHSKEPQKLIKKYGLEQYIGLYPFLPYKKFLYVIRKSSFLILPHGGSISTSVLYPTKFFDYLGVKRPILYIGIEGQVSETINDCKAGLCTKPEPEEISKSFKKIVREINKEDWYMEELNYKKFDRVNIFNNFCNKLNSVINKTKTS